MLLLIYLYLDRAKKKKMYFGIKINRAQWNLPGNKIAAEYQSSLPNPSLYPNSDVGNIGNRVEFVSFLESEKAAIWIHSTQEFLPGSAGAC